MSNEKRIKLELTPEQREQVRKAIGEEASVIEITFGETGEMTLGVAQLEDRIAPARIL